MSPLSDFSLLFFSFYFFHQGGIVADFLPCIRLKAARASKELPPKQSGTCHAEMLEIGVLDTSSLLTLDGQGISVPPQKACNFTIGPRATLGLISNLV